MSNTQSTLRILEKANLAQEIDAFLIDRRARALSPRTLDYYEQKLTLFRAYLQGEGIRAVESITAPIVRRFMLELSKTHNPGGGRGRVAARGPYSSPMTSIRIPAEASSTRYSKRSSTRRCTCCCRRQIAWSRVSPFSVSIR